MKTRVKTRVLFNLLRPYQRKGLNQKDTGYFEEKG